MLNNAVDSTKREGTGKKGIKILASSPMQRENFECDGKFVGITLDFAKGSQSIKLEPNTQKDVEKRLAKQKNNGQELSH